MQKNDEYLDQKKERKILQHKFPFGDGDVMGAAPPCNLSIWELRLVDLHVVGRPNGFQKEPAKAAVATSTNQFH